MVSFFLIQIIYLKEGSLKNKVVSGEKWSLLDTLDGSVQMHLILILVYICPMCMWAVVKKKFSSPLTP